jgi:hypothetical protein
MLLAFGREVAIKTLVSVLTVAIVGGLAAIWGAIKYLAPSIATYYRLSWREALAWATVAALSVVVVVLSSYLASLQRRKPSSLTTTLNNAVKPSITLKNHGGPTTYRVDGRMVALVNGTANPQPAPFRCELQVGGIKGEWDARLNDGDWANVIFGSIEPVYAAGPVGKVLVGHQLVIRRGKVGQHLGVPDTGAIVELTIQATPQLSQPLTPRQFQIVRNGNTVNVTEL